MTEIARFKKGEFYMIYNPKTKCAVIGSWVKRTRAHQVFHCDSEACNPLTSKTLNTSWSNNHYFGVNLGWKFFHLNLDEVCNHVMVYTI